MENLVFSTKWLLNYLRSQFQITEFLLLFVLVFAPHFYLPQLFSRQFTVQNILVLCTSGYNRLFFPNYFSL